MSWSQESQCIIWISTAYPTAVHWLSGCSYIVSKFNKTNRPLTFPLFHQCMVYREYCIFLEWRTVSALTRWLFWCLLVNKYQNNTQVSVETVRHESTYIVVFLTRHSESMNDEKNDDLYTSSPCLIRSVFVLLMSSQSIADDVTMTRHIWRIHVNSDI